MGGLAFCNQHTLTMRVAKAQDCLDALADLPCPQTALLLLRSCASFARLTRLRRRLRTRTPCRSSTAACAPTWSKWVGSRSPTAHGHRQCWAFPLAGWACAVLPGMLRLHTWPLWHPPLRPALSSTGSTRLTWPSPLLSLTGPCLPLCPPFMGWSSSRTCLLRLMLQPPSHFFKAAATSPCTLTCSLSGNLARAPGCSLGPLRLLVWPGSRVSSASCSACVYDGAADRFGDHARARACGGDRTKRHSRLRTVLASRAAAAGLSLEVEKAGLLPARVSGLGACEAGAAHPTPAVQDSSLTLEAAIPQEVWDSVPYSNLHPSEFLYRPSADYGT